MGTAKKNPYNDVTPADDGWAQQGAAEAKVRYCEAEQDARIKAERLLMHRKAVNMIVGLWKDREGGPVDGVDYQSQHRAAW